MEKATPIPEPDLLALARPVSRSFYLSLRFLPRPLRAPVTLGYLLARASDTLADEAVNPAAAQQAEAILRRWQAGQWEIPRAWPELGCSPAERELLGHMPRLLDLLTQHRDADLLSTVWQHILRGQRADLQRQICGTNRTALTREALDEYVYAVAGSVGEFWTRLAERHLPGVFCLPLPELLPLARAYGEGLQWLNIFRDQLADDARQRTYLDESLAKEAERIIRKKLAAAAQYARCIRRAGFYFPTMLPAALAEAMLPQLRPGNKLSRGAVLATAGATFWRALLCPWRAGAARFSRAVCA